MGELSEGLGWIFGAICAFVGFVLILVGALLYGIDEAVVDSMRHYELGPSPCVLVTAAEYTSDDCKGLSPGEYVKVCHEGGACDAYIFAGSDIDGEKSNIGNEKLHRRIATSCYGLGGKTELGGVIETQCMYTKDETQGFWVATQTKITGCSDAEPTVITKDLYTEIYDPAESTANAGFIVLMVGIAAAVLSICLFCSACFNEKLCDCIDDLKRPSPAKEPVQYPSYAANAKADEKAGDEEMAERASEDDDELAHTANPEMDAAFPSPFDTHLAPVESATDDAKTTSTDTTGWGTWVAVSVLGVCALGFLVATIAAAA